MYLADQAPFVIRFRSDSFEFSNAFQAAVPAIGLDPAMPEVPAGEATAANVGFRLRYEMDNDNCNNA